MAAKRGMDGKPKGEDLAIAIKEPRQTINSKLSTPEEQEPLGLSEQLALTDMRRVTYATDGRPLELLRSVDRPAFFRSSILRSRRAY
jgi:DNA-binding GntR family transcriptional regulator